MNILIAGSKSRQIHLKNFSDELENLQINCKAIVDTDFIEKTLSFDLKNRREKKRKRNEMISDFKPDLVVLDRISKLGEFFLDKKIPLFFLLRGNYWEELEWVKKINEGSGVKSLSIYKNQKLADRIFRESKGIIAISNYLKNEALKKYPQKKIDVIYADGRIISEWKEENKQKYEHPCVGLVQGLNIWGKTKELKTLEKVLEKMPDVKFYLAGDGDNRDKIIPQLQKYQNFIWLGNLEYPKKIKEMFSSIDIFLLLSGLEGLGQTIIEAMLMKKPIIATNVGGIPEIIKDSETGFLVEPSDSEKIIFLIKELLSKPEIIDKITGNAIKDVQKFSWKNIAVEFLSVIQKNEIK